MTNQSTSRFRDEITHLAGVFDAERERLVEAGLDPSWGDEVRSNLTRIAGKRSSTAAIRSLTTLAERFYQVSDALFSPAEAAERGLLGGAVSRRTAASAGGKTPAGATPRPGEEGSGAMPGTQAAPAVEERVADYVAEHVVQAVLPDLGRLVGMPTLPMMTRAVLKLGNVEVEIEGEGETLHPHTIDGHEALDANEYVYKCHGLSTRKCGKWKPLQYDEEIERKTTKVEWKHTEATDANNPNITRVKIWKETTYHLKMRHVTWNYRICCCYWDILPFDARFPYDCRAEYKKMDDTVKESDQTVPVLVDEDDYINWSLELWTLIKNLLNSAAGAAGSAVGGELKGPVSGLSGPAKEKIEKKVREILGLPPAPSSQSGGSAGGSSSGGSSPGGGSAGGASPGGSSSGGGPK